MKKRKRKPPSLDTWYGWSRRVNGYLLNEIGLGLWQLTGQSDFKAMFEEGVSPATAAQTVLYWFDRGEIRRRYSRKKRR